MSLHLELECLSDVVMTAQSATVAGFESLSYIRGGSLLGAVAARCYGRGTPGDDWRMFHDGTVRFGDARLVSAHDAVTWPVPLSLHKEKGEVIGHDTIDAARVFNLAVMQREAGKQYQQLRDRGIDLHGAYADPARRRSMRTAIARDGRARDAYLYELDAIAAGTRLRCVVDSHDDVLLARIRDAVVDREVAIGRGRSAEFGRVAVRACAPELARTPEADGGAPRNRVVLWCLSDLCLCDELTLQPTLRPAATHFGLPPTWSLDAGASFLRTRRYAPFNGARRRPDAERQVIVAGSVLVLRGPALENAARERARERIARGVGEHRNEGLGTLAFNPALLQHPHPLFEPAPPAPAAVAALAMPDDALAAWVLGTVERRGRRDEVWRSVREVLAQIEGARAWQGVPPSQWGELRRVARENRGRPRTEVLEALDHFFLEGVRALEVRWGAKHAGQTLGGALRAVVEADGDTTEQTTVLELVATHAARAQRGRAGGAR
jgi:CRISPR-associated protein Csx10